MELFLSNRTIAKSSGVSKGGRGRGSPEKRQLNKSICAASLIIFIQLFPQVNGSLLQVSPVSELLLVLLSW